MRFKLLPLLALAFAAPAFAQDATPPTTLDPTFSQGGGAIPALPLEVQKSGDISYINGGIGEEELDQIKAQTAQYNFRLLFSSSQGEYITSVHVRVLDASGAAILDVADAGPYLYAKMPAGSYTLETSNKAEQTPRTMSITVPAGGFYRNHIVYQ